MNKKTSCSKNWQPVKQVYRPDWRPRW